MIGRLVARLRGEDGLGLIELVIALLIINVAIFALYTSFTAAGSAVLRANRVSTATVVAEKQIELYRAMLWNRIGLKDTSITASASDTVHTGDASWPDAQTAYASCTASAPECMAVQGPVTGPDGKTWRIDTYISTLVSGAGGVTSGRPVKRVTVTVRRWNDQTAAPLARLVAAFDRSTGCIYGSTTDPC